MAVPAEIPTGAPARRLRLLLTVVVWALPIGLILVPLALFVVQSLFRVEGAEIVYEPSLINYVRFFTDPIFVPIFITTCLLALEVALITVVLAYPVALLLASFEGRKKYVATIVFVIPLLMSYIIKIYAIRSILGGNGFLNQHCCWSSAWSTSR